jgi:hypothetical protein
MGSRKSCAPAPNHTPVIIYPYRLADSPDNSIAIQPAPVVISLERNSFYGVKTEDVL